MESTASAGYAMAKLVAFSNANRHPCKEESVAPEEAGVGFGDADSVDVGRGGLAAMAGACSRWGLD